MFRFLKQVAPINLIYLWAKSYRKIPFLVALVITYPAMASSQFKLCKIQYGDKNLERNIVSLNLKIQHNNQMMLNCHQIGVEFSENRVPQRNKPIYACCSDLQ